VQKIFCTADIRRHMAGQKMEGLDGFDAVTDKNQYCGS